MLSAARGVILNQRWNMTAQLLRHEWRAARLFSETVGSEGSHDDFKAQTKDVASASDVFETIKSDISTNQVFVYMKGVPEAPMCGFSMTVCRILDAYGARYGSRNVLDDPELREGIKKFSNWPTIPQVFVEGEFIGGCDILRQMHENGELSQVLKLE